MGLAAFNKQRREQALAEAKAQSEKPTEKPVEKAEVIHKAKKTKSKTFN